MSDGFNRRQWIQRTSAVVAGFSLPAAVFSRAARTAWAADAEKPFDLLIVGGTLIDGSGGPRSNGDLGIRDGRIAAIGDLKDRAAKRTLEAAGRVVSPGFIDMHTH